MAHTCKLYTKEQTAEWFDKANKLGWKEDPQNKFISLDLNAEEEKLRSYTNYAYGSLNSNKTYGSLVVPRRTSIPIVYVSKDGNSSWTFHRDDSYTESMTREYSIVLAMNAPEEYDDGEIVVRSGGAEVNYKLPVGMALVVPSTSYLKFRSVTKGQRIICRWSIESYIKDHDYFNINFQYNQMYDALSDGLSEPADEMFAVTNNMLLNKVASFDLDDAK